jgi:nicotinate-nucleotide adenylyltransferase
LKIGLMGGTFDPIHLGHLRAAENAREALGLDEVAFVPAGSPPHRRGPLSPALDRYAMVCLATAAHPAFVASDLELRRQGPSYTADTVKALREERPRDSVVLIVGSDTFPEMTSWREPESLFALCSVAVVPRPGESGEPPRASQPAPDHLPSSVGVAFLEQPSLPVSGTEIRRRVREGRSIRYLVPEAVAEYIRKRGLYR